MMKKSKKLVSLLLSLVLCLGMLPGVALAADSSNFSLKAYIAQGHSGDVVIPEGVTSISNCYGSGWWDPDNSVTSITFPSTMTEIPIAATLCPNLTDVTIPPNITKIDMNAFARSVASDGPSIYPVETLTVHGAPGSAAEAFVEQMNNDYRND